MDCAEIRQGFMTGGVPSGSSVDEHRHGCAHCNELFGNAAELGRHLADVASCVPHAALTKQLRATESLLADERGIRAFLRSRSTRVRWVSSLILPALLLVRELLQQRVSLSELGATRVLAGLLLLGLLGVFAYSALRPLPIEPRAARLRSVLALIAWSLPCVLWFAPDAPVSADHLANSGLGTRALTCFGYGSALSAPSFVLLWAFDRGERVPFRVWLLGAGLVAVLSNLILLLHCSSTQKAHLIAGHFSIGLAWFAALSLGACWGSRLR
ncbi:MAG TPA: hypothetical protein VJV79_25600 [Polyangiaceae bacterium]|nr:hypothetical protein [Polyangiaceae bacterium]